MCRTFNVSVEVRFFRQNFKNLIRFLKNLIRFLENLIRFLKNLIRFLENLLRFWENLIRFFEMTNYWKNLIRFFNNLIRFWHLSISLNIFKHFVYVMSFSIFLKRPYRFGWCFSYGSSCTKNEGHEKTQVTISIWLYYYWWWEQLWKREREKKLSLRNFFIKSTLPSKFAAIYIQL